MRTFRITEADYIKAHRKASREEEIASHGHLVHHRKVHISKKAYNRRKLKAGDKGLPLFFNLISHHIPDLYIWC